MIVYICCVVICVLSLLLESSLLYLGLSLSLLFG
jgi:hypothetical protein